MSTNMTRRGFMGGLMASVSTIALGVPVVKKLADTYDWTEYSKGFTLHGVDQFNRPVVEYISPLRPDLSEASLEAALREVRKMHHDPAEMLAIVPTKMFLRAT